jgi:hypothetical protein
MNISIFLGLVASCLGIWYAWLGITALRHLSGASEVDKTVGWSLWWCLDISRYDDVGKRICKHGQIAALLAIVLWIVTYSLQK